MEDLCARVAQAGTVDEGGPVSPFTSPSCGLANNPLLGPMFGITLGHVMLFASCYLDKT